ncbi:Aste57867_17175 [Aphanomyces stellatus]|uniref:Aste57867_17175 protein n=1 Tax=Aphanomyces stellatus TaxID=120398 RepID=A0A485L759_9STRA|nr:hypothetical protein As57867_017116 [Aphanomyces stellatus]VFT93932.1 Aste57867_17175 [Aphanomyces stellatus]
MIEPRKPTRVSLQSMDEADRMVSKQTGGRSVKAATSCREKDGVLSGTTVAIPDAAPAKLPVVSITADQMQDHIRHLLSGTGTEAAGAIEAISAAVSDIVSMELFIVNSGVPPLIRQACRESSLKESSPSMKLLFHLFLHNHQLDIVDKITAVTRTKVAPLEQKNALRILLAFTYAFLLPDVHPVKPELIETTKELLLHLLRNLWHGTSADVTHSLECLAFIAVTPSYHEPLMALMEQPLPKPSSDNPAQLNRASTYLTISRDGSSSVPLTARAGSRRSSWVKIRSAIFETGLDMLKDFMTAKQATIRNGTNGLARIASQGTLTERELVTAIIAELGRNDECADVQSVCAGFCKALVSSLGDPEVSDIHKIQAITCIEHLVPRDIMRRHLLEAGLSPELYLLAQLGGEGPRHHAERVLAALLEKPDVQEYFKPPE